MLYYKNTKLKKGKEGKWGFKENIYIIQAKSKDYTKSTIKAVP